MKRKIAFLLLLASLALGYFVYAGSVHNQRQAPNESVKPMGQQIELVLDYGDGRVDSYQKEFSEPTTVSNLLESVASEKQIELKIKQYDFGVFVESVGDKVGNAETAWIYFVNVVSGDVAADQKNLQVGDKVEWKYIKPK